MHQIEHADQVDVDGVDERLSRTALGQRGDAGIGHHDVELAEFGHARVDGRRQGSAVADVGDNREGVAAFLLDQACGLVQILGPGQRIVVGGDVLAQVDRDDVGALGGQQSRVRPALPARRTGDDGDFALNSARHCYSSFALLPAADSAVADGLRFQVLLETFDAVLPADPAGLVPAIRCVSPVEEAAVDVDGSDAQPARRRPWPGP